jgi:3-hydroxyacyl-[acyl-carrier-protein] dehydratase
MADTGTVQNAKAGVKLDRKRIMQMIPHRDPFLMVDEVIDLVPAESATGVKHVSAKEYYFKGHFPQRPIMPGVLIIETMAQTAALVVVYTLGAAFEGKLVYFMSIDEARFRKPVFPGDTLMVHVSKLRNRGNVWKFRGEAKVGNTLVAEAVYTAMILDE